MSINLTGISEDRAQLENKVQQEILDGKYLNLETLLFIRHARIAVLEFKRSLRGQAQAGWDPLGTHHLATSLQSLGGEASKLNENLSKTGEDLAQVSSRLNDTMTMLMTSVMPDFGRAVNSFQAVQTNGLDVNVFDFGFITKFFEGDPKMIILGCATLFLMVEFISHKYDIPYINHIRTVLATVMIFKVGGAMRGLFLSWLTSVFTPLAQSDWQDWLQVAVQGVIFAVFGSTLDFTTLSRTVKQLGEAASNTLRLQELFTLVVGWFKDVNILVAEYCGYEVFEWMKPQEPRIREMLKEVNELTATYNNDPMSVKIEFVERVTRLMIQLNDIVAKTPITSKNQPVLVAVKNLQDKIATLQRCIANVGLNVGDRYEPAFINTSGAVGCGKTYMSEYANSFYAMQMASTPEEVMQAQLNYSSYIYDWPLENKHHDQYMGQAIINYPDLFCQTDAEGVVGEPASLVYLIGDNPFTLPAADMMKKQRLWCIANLITACSNVIYINRSMFKSIRNPDAVIRRLNEHSWYMYVNEKYAQKDGAGNIIIDAATHRVKGYEHDDRLYGQVDRDLVPAGRPPADLWFFRRLDYGSGQFKDNKIYDFNGYLRNNASYILWKRQRGAEKKESVKNTAALLAQERLAELMNPIHQTDEGAEEFIIDEDFKPFNPLIEPILDPTEEAIKKLDRQIMSDFLLEQRYQAALAKKFDRTDEDILNEALEELEECPGLEDEKGDLIDDTPSLLDYETGDEEPGKPQSDDKDIEEPYSVINSAKKRTEEARSRVYNWVTLPVSEIAKSKISKKEYDAIIGHITECVTVINGGTHNLIDNVALMRLQAGAKVDPKNPRRGDIYLAMLTAITNMQEDPECAGIARTLTVTQLFDFSKYSYEEVSDRLIEFRYNYIIRDPVIATLNTLAATFSNFYNTVASSPVGTVLTCLKDMLFSREFLSILNGFVEGFLLTSGILLPLVFLDWWAQNNAAKRAKKKQEEKIKVKSLNTIPEANWTTTENVNKTIDAHMDNFAGLYVTIHKPVDGVMKQYVRHPCNVFFLGGKVGVIVDHAKKGILQILEWMKDKTDCRMEISLIPFSGRALEKCTERVAIEDVVFETNEYLVKRDLCVIKFKHIRNRPNIYHMIPPLNCMDYLQEQKNIEGVFIERPTTSSLEMVGREKRVDVVLNFSETYYSADVLDMISEQRAHVGDYGYRSFEVKGKDDTFVTKSGYCTSPGFVTDVRKNFCVNMGFKQASQPWLAYLHTSLYNHVPNGVPIFREMFEEWTYVLDKTHLKPVIESLNENVKVYKDIISEELGLTPDGVGDMDTLTFEFERLKLDANHESIASMEHSFYEPSKTDIKRSPCYGVVPRTRYPTRRGVVKTVDGKYVNVMDDARELCGANTAFLNGPVVTAIMHQAMARVMTDSSKPVYRNTLSFDQCLYGDAAYNLNSVNWQSSCGFYLRLMKDYFKTDWKTKAWMLDGDKLKPEIYRVIKRLFDHYDAKICKGERVCSLVIDSIKDELLAKEKILQGKGRLFCIYDFVYLLLCKKYCGAFAGWIYENRIRNGIAIGVNPYSTDWDAIAHKVTSNSTKCVFLDHSKFDKYQLRLIMSCILVLMTMYYGDAGSVEEKAREALLEDVINSVHVVMKDGKLVVYEWGQGNTSGNFLTAILNSLVNEVYMYICCIFAWLLFLGIDPNLLKALPENPCDEAFTMVSLGDDVVGSINSDLMPGVNFNTIQKVAKIYLGIIVTDELKSGGEIPDFREITEGSFLGRGFVQIIFRNSIRMAAPLRIYSAVERVNWIKGVYDPLIEVEKFESANLELSNHPKDVFYSMVPDMAEECFKQYGIYPRFTDYDIARNHLLSLADYRYSFADFLNEEEDFKGPSLAKILQTFRENAERESYVAGFKADFEAILLTDDMIELKEKTNSGNVAEASWEQPMEIETGEDLYYQKQPGEGLTASLQ